MNYIRYVAYFNKGANPWHQNGLLSFCRIEHWDKLVSVKSKKIIQDIYDWYNDNIPVPPFKINLKSKKWTEDAISWWKEDAKQPIELMKKLTKILRKNGYKVKVMKVKNPGKILYEDKWQVVAKMPNKYGIH